MIQTVICKCCGKKFKADIPKMPETPNRDGYIECVHCGYEHVVYIRNNTVVAITTP